jgi:hypothetical protein
MKGFGSNNDWPYYASPSSNLSAFATPFSVNRHPIDVSAPFIDPTDAVRPSLPYRYPNPIKESDSDSSNQFGYLGLHDVLDFSGSQLPHRGQFANANVNATIEPKQYFNSYGLHHDHNSKSVVPDHWSSFSGFTSSDGAGASRTELGFAGQSVVGNQFADFGDGKGNQIGVGSSLASNQTNFTGSVVDERINLGMCLLLILLYCCILKVIFDCLSCIRTLKLSLIRVDKKKGVFEIFDSILPPPKEKLLSNLDVINYIDKRVSSD